MGTRHGANAMTSTAPPVAHAPGPPSPVHPGLVNPGRQKGAGQADQHRWALWTNRSRRPGLDRPQCSAVCPRCWVACASRTRTCVHPNIFIACLPLDLPVDGPPSAALPRCPGHGCVFVLRPSAPGVSTVSWLTSACASFRTPRANSSAPWARGCAVARHQWERTGASRPIHSVRVTLANRRG